MELEIARALFIDIVDNSKLLRMGLGLRFRLRRKLQTIFPANLNDSGYVLLLLRSHTADFLEKPLKT